MLEIKRIVEPVLNKDETSLHYVIPKLTELVPGLSIVVFCKN